MMCGCLVGPEAGVLDLGWGGIPWSSILWLMSWRGDPGRLGWAGGRRRGRLMVQQGRAEQGRAPASGGRDIPNWNYRAMGCLG